MQVQMQVQVQVQMQVQVQRQRQRQGHGRRQRQSHPLGVPEKHQEKENIRCIGTCVHDRDTARWSLKRDIAETNMGTPGTE